VDNKILTLTGTGSPIGLVTSEFIGQEHIDTQNKVVYKAIGFSIANDLVTISPHMVVPDYANQETTNRITSNNNYTWTADRNGFIFVFVQNHGNGRVKINNKIAFGLYNASAGLNTLAGITLPIKSNNVIYLDNSIDSSMTCYFISTKNSVSIKRYLIRQRQ
jgi:hypothetical protein